MCVYGKYKECQQLMEDVGIVKTKQDVKYQDYHRTFLTSAKQTHFNANCV